MNGTEYKDLLKLYSTYWPAFSPTPEIVKAWQGLLIDLNAVPVFAAIQQIAAEGEKFAPPPGVLRNRALDIIEPPELSADEAWQQVLNNISSGAYGQPIKMGIADDHSIYGATVVKMSEEQAAKYVPEEFTPELIEALRTRHERLRHIRVPFDDSPEGLREAAIRYIQDKYKVEAWTEKGTYPLAPLAREIVQQIGWKQLREADAFATNELRRRFVKLYEAEQAKRRAERRMPPTTKALLGIDAAPKPTAFQALIADAESINRKELEA